jgi:hypothetical protein
LGRAAMVWPRSRTSWRCIMASGLLANTIKQGMKVWIVVSDRTRGILSPAAEGVQDRVGETGREQAGEASGTASEGAHPAQHEPARRRTAASRRPSNKSGTSDAGATKLSSTAEATPAVVATRPARQTAARPAAAVDATSSRRAAPKKAVGRKPTRGSGKVSAADGPAEPGATPEARLSARDDAPDRIESPPAQQETGTILETQSPMDAAAEPERRVAEVRTEMDQGAPAAAISPEPPSQEGHAVSPG